MLFCKDQPKNGLPQLYEIYIYLFFYTACVLLLWFQAFKQELCIMKFSQRISKTPIRESLQVETIDEALKNGLWNIIYIFYFNDLGHNWGYYNGEKRQFFNGLWHYFFKQRIDTIPYLTDDIIQFIREWYYNAEWYEVFDLIEWISEFDSNTTHKDIAFAFNSELEKEMSAYRIIDKRIVQITDESEIREIETAIEDTKKTKMSPISEHLQSALEKLADRKNPDFRNSIKESISAVEAIANIISGKQGASLGDALKIIEQKIGLHPALKKGFSAIYGYTSDEGGIRHALTEENNIPFEDAKYMLVSCAAFINYLKVKAAKAEQ